MGPTDSTAAPMVIAGHYRIVELLGEGGWARVYRAVDLNLQREVALKRLRPDKFPDPGSARRLMREARNRRGSDPASGGCARRERAGN